MRIPFFHILSFLVIAMYGQEPINQTDEKGLPHGKWEKKYPNGNIRYKGVFEHGREIGVFEFYDIKGGKHPTATKTYKAGNDSVQVAFFTDRGKLQSRGMMLDKKREGAWLYYFNDGKTLLSREYYKWDQLEGKKETFYTDGQPAEIAHYHQGKLHGNRSRYNEQGKIYESTTYKNGVIHGPVIIYKSPGVAWAKGQYAQGRKSGVWSIMIDSVWVKTENPENFIRSQTLGEQKKN